MDRQLLIATAKQTIKTRKDNHIPGLTPDFYDGFAEGIAEMLGIILKESVTDLLSEITSK